MDRDGTAEAREAPNAQGRAQMQVVQDAYAAAQATEAAQTFEFKKIVSSYSPNSEIPDCVSEICFVLMVNRTRKWRISAVVVGLIAH